MFALSGLALAYHRLRLLWDLPLGEPVRLAMRDHALEDGYRGSAPGIAAWLREHG